MPLGTDGTDGARQDAAGRGVDGNDAIVAAPEVPRLRFTLDEADRAAEAWGFNCGPAAVAAICGLSIGELRPHLGDFEQKRYTNPTLMFQILRSLDAAWRRMPTAALTPWPAYGLARIQWEGPWMEPGVPIGARYRQTHWVGCCARNPDHIGIFDINCLNNGSGWVALEDWAAILVPAILKACHPRANGGWHITHSLAVDCTRAAR